MRRKASARARRHLADSVRVAARLLELEAESRRTMTVQERADARTWYTANRLRLERMAFEADLHPEAVIHAAATLSPATSWATLLDRLPAFLRAARSGELLPAFPTYGRQRYLAARMVYQGLVMGGEASGPKVRPFALALMGDASQVVVDRHVARYALADPTRTQVTVTERRAIQDAHKVAGTALGIAPRDLQSLLWVARVGFDGVYGTEPEPAGEVAP